MIPAEDHERCFRNSLYLQKSEPIILSTIIATIKQPKQPINLTILLA